VVCEQCGRQEVCPSNLVTSLDESELPVRHPGHQSDQPPTPATRTGK
jgi:hypothetical protein